MVWLLADHPEVWEAVATGQHAATEVVEEVLRLRSTATSVARTATVDGDLHGTPVQSGDLVFVSLWSADHDPAAFDDPERFDPAAHAGASHVAFGHGPHHCLGAALARAELQVALEVLTRRIGPPTVAGTVTWRPPLGITGPEQLPITFEPRS
jgi:cytochrome P450